MALEVDLTVEPVGSTAAATARLWPAPANGCRTLALLKRLERKWNKSDRKADCLVCGVRLVVDSLAKVPKWGVVVCYLFAWAGCLPGAGRQKWNGKRR